MALAGIWYCPPWQVSGKVWVGHMALSKGRVWLKICEVLGLGIEAAGLSMTTGLCFTVPNYRFCCSTQAQGVLGQKESDFEITLVGRP
jgi:hypothetical protein